MDVEIIQPGLATTVQDRGRTGYYHLGIPQGGALDQYSYELGNALVGNLDGEAALECTYMGPEIRAHGRCLVAVTGASVEVRVNDDVVPQWTSFTMETDDVLSFGIISEGARFYIAFGGGVDVPEVLGSRSTYPIGRLGGVEGRQLDDGDRISIAGTGAGEVGAEIPEELRPTFPKDLTVRIITGLYDHLLTEKGRRNLLEEEWSLTPVADRMGMRFEGPGVEWKEREQPFGAGSDPSNIVDAGYAVGSIQIPGGTQPIILHRDAVSAGGYAMVGTVISADMDAVGRAAPGTVVHFSDVTMDEALEARRKRGEALRTAIDSLR
ncbi:5-oxoprolinase subunit C family protein [Nesterenkonia marinintestina]|uniref:5-oxoprolinase subunit C family protein n=1 Tax=Nesterenkonia marinintestina TaxID=2979865 RepID=UPI0021C220B8|nr:biotin-dependent carboxyltransferase family protein [Nesterenkonia sp. GX14115]